MRLYVNGDSHSAGHDAGGINASYGKHIANALGAEFDCDARAGCSNDRIIRTTKEYLAVSTPDLLIIGWSTPEREEWEVNGVSYSVSAGMELETFPLEMRSRYKEWVITNSDSGIQKQKELKWHNDAHELHTLLIDAKIPHLFFNCYSYYHYIKYWNLPRFEWGSNYIDPYNKDLTYYFWLKNQGFTPANPRYFHYGPDAHVAWANFLLPKLREL